MRLSLNRVVPLPLKDKVNAYNSWVWNQELNFNKGEQVFIQAPSGTGKTTLVHLLYGLRSDYDGKINWSAYRMDNIKPEQLSQLRATSISVVFQDLRLFPELTAWENIEIKRRLTNVVTEFDAEQWLGRLGLDGKLHMRAATMSYGEQQRVAIVRALVQPFEWLLLDEPFSHLDNFNKQKAIALIKEVLETTKGGLILADLEDNDFFPYTTKLLL